MMKAEGGLSALCFFLCVYTWDLRSGYCSMLSGGVGGEFAVEAVGGGGEGAAGDGGGAEFAAELVDGLVELAGAVALFVGEEGELLGLAVGEVTEGDAEQAEGAAVPRIRRRGTWRSHRTPA